MMNGKETAPLSQEHIDYKARQKRVSDAIQLKQPDRVPVAVFDEYFCLSLGGVTPGDAFYDYQKATEVFCKEVVRFNWDMVTVHGNFPGPVAESVGLKTNKWAGYNLPATQQYQFVEKEYMLADEYDQFLKDPGDFTVRTLWPRMAESLAPFAIFPPLVAMSNGYSPIAEIALLAGQPEVRQMLENLIKMGEEMNQYLAALDQTVQALAQMGIPVISENVIAQAPFDWISDYLRGIKGSTMDMFYQPDKLKAAIEMITPTLIDYWITTAQELGDSVVFIPLHRGADSFMSNDQFAEFYWPSLKELFLAIIDAGLTPLPYWEGSYTSRLEFLAELPPGKIWGHFETVDLEKAREMIGDVMCFWGNVPAQILISGTPDQTREYVIKLIDIFGDTGGLIVDGSLGIPKEAKLENVEAMTEAVFKYGVY